MFVEYDDQLCLILRHPGFYISCNLFENLQVPARLCRKALEFTSGQASALLTSLPSDLPHPKGTSPNMIIDQHLPNTDDHQWRTLATSEFIIIRVRNVLLLPTSTSSATNLPTVNPQLAGHLYLIKGMRTSSDFLAQLSTGLPKSPISSAVLSVKDRCTLTYRYSSDRTSSW